MKYDIFIQYKSQPRQWHCYVQAVTMTNTRNIVAALERDGESVSVFYHAKVLGKQVYDTAEGWNFRRNAA